MLHPSYKLVKVEVTKWGQNITIYIILLGKRPFRRPAWNIILKWTLKRMGKCVNRINTTQVRGSCEEDNIPFGSINCSEHRIHTVAFNICIEQFFPT
jgi:hypothetical protein